MLAKRIVNFEKGEYYAPSGKQTLETYTPYTTDGREKLEKTGETNIYDQIQADLEESKVENIIKRAMMGDFSGLKKSDPQYVDTSTMPSSMMEVQNKIVKMKTEFDKMPEEVKRLFNYSAEEYVNEMGTKEYLEKMKPFIEKIDKISMEKNAKEYEKKVKDKAQLNWDVEQYKKTIEYHEQHRDDPKGGKAE